MGKQAPLCSVDACGNRTWHPSGLCYLHVNSRAGGNSSGQQWSPPTSTSDPFGHGADAMAPLQILQSARGAFPSVGSDPHPSTLRQQVVGTIDQAVALEAWRRFPTTAYMDDHSRDDSLQAHYHELLQHLTPAPVTISDRDAAMVSNSVDDHYGRGLDESRALASYALRKEWEMSRATGVETDENGITYGDDFPRYCDRNRQYFQRVVSDEYMRQLNSYDTIVASALGGQQQFSPPVQEVPQEHYQEQVYQEGDSLGDTATDALKSLGKMLGKSALRHAKSAPRRFVENQRNLNEQARQAREEIAEQKRRSEDELMRRVAVKQAKNYASRHIW